MKIIQKISNKTVNVIAFIILSILLVLNILYTTNIIGLEEHAKIIKTPFISVIATIIIFFMYIAILKILTNKIFEKKKKIIIVIALILYTIINIAWINWAKISPTDDAKTVHNIAIAFVKNNKDVLYKSTYLEKCPQQIGMALFFSIIYKVTGTTDYKIIQYLNILANILTIIALYKIIKKIDNKNEKTQFAYFLLILPFIPLILLTTYVYGDYIGLSLMSWAIFFIMKYKIKYERKYLILSAFLMMLSCIIKTNYMVSLIAIIIYLIMDIVCNNKKIFIKILLIIIYLMIVIIPYTTLKNKVATELNLIKTESIPTTGYLYIGMSESDKGAGWYGEAVQPAWDDATKSRKIYPKLIKHRLIEFSKKPMYCLDFYTRKITSGWNEPYFQSTWYALSARNKNENFNEPNNKLYLIIKYYMKSLTTIIYLSTAIYIFNNEKKINIDELLLLIIFIGGFLFHLLWEIKARYTLPYIIIIMPLAAKGLTNIANYIEKKVVKN